MTVSRAIQIDLQDTPYYHCISRCVRRAFLCGKDYETGKDFNHRKQWIINRIKYLASIFCIDICAYAMMSNHYHLVLFVDCDKAASLTEAEVFSQWEAICPNDAHKYQDLDVSDPILIEKIAQWRERLTNISWFMKFLNEYIARRANKEEKSSGKFWECRFKSQALLDECAVLSAMAYVDLNPIRAGVAKTPESSEFTSIYERIQYIDKQRKMRTKQCKTKKHPAFPKDCDNLKQPPKLLPLLNDSKAEKIKISHINFKLSDYLVLVDITGRLVREGKRGKIPSQCENILDRLNINSTSWLEMVKGLEKQFCFAVGDPTRLAAYGAAHRISSPKGLSAAKRIYLNDAA